MLVEAARARRNERQQTARGGVEPQGDVYDLMRVAYPASFVAMIGEGWMRGVPGAPLFAAGAALFVAAKTLKNLGDPVPWFILDLSRDRRAWRPAGFCRSVPLRPASQLHRGVR
jgi:hypothetical protein